MNDPVNDYRRGERRLSLPEEAELNRPLYQSLRSSKRRVFLRLADKVRRRAANRRAAIAAATAAAAATDTDETSDAAGDEQPPPDQQPPADADEQRDDMEDGGNAPPAGDADAAPPAQVVRTVPDLYAPPIFRGESSVDASAWLGHFQRYVVCRGLTAAEQKDFFSLSLRDGAYDWFESLPDASKVDIGAIVTAFKAYYVPTDFDAILSEDSVFSRNQRQGETARDYVAAMKKLVRRLPNVEGDTFRLLVVRGLLPHVKRHVVQQNCQTIDDILKAARIAELSAAPAEADLGELVAEVRASRAEMRQLTAKVNSMSVNAVAAPPSRSPTPDRRSPMAPRRVTFNGEARQPRPPPPRSGQTWNRRSGPGMESRNQSQRGAGCMRCGKNHFGSVCRFINAKCYRCQRIGHISACCRSGQRANDGQH